MISSLNGIVGRKDNHGVEIEVNGVGYWVGVNRKFLSDYNTGDKVKVMTYLAVSENDMSLFGFDNLDDLEVFKLLITVSGIGAKTAVGIMSETAGEKIVRAIGEADVDFFQKIKGIGKKTAQRIIVDLKSKVGGLGELDLGREDEEKDEVFLSLKQLGFGADEIKKMREKMPTDLMSLEEKIEWCLKNLG